MERKLLSESVKSLLETKGNAAGFVYAKVSGGRVFAASNLVWKVEGDVCWCGAVVDTDNHGWMKFPLSVVGNGPHELKLPVRPSWSMTVDNRDYEPSGLAVFNFRDDRKTIHGVFDLVLEKGVTMVGGFYITIA